MSSFSYEASLATIFGRENNCRHPTDGANETKTCPSREWWSQELSPCTVNPWTTYASRGLKSPMLAVWGGVLICKPEISTCLDIYIYICVCVRDGGRTLTRRSREHFCGVSSLFPSLLEYRELDSGHQACSQHLYPLSHLKGPPPPYFLFVYLFVFLDRISP